MASFTSEYDSNTFTGEKMQRDLSSYFFSLTTNINRVSQKPLVPVNMQTRAPTSTHCNGPAVRVDCFCFLLFVNSLSSPDIGHSEGRSTAANVGVHSYLSY